MHCMNREKINKTDIFGTLPLRQSHDDELTNYYKVPLL